ncbi:MAG: hypothetical protein ABL951_05405 [Alphaproteobacteria bacterium]
MPALPVLGGSGAHPPSSQEDALYDFAARLAHHKEGRRAVHVRLSRLIPGNRLEHHIRIVMNTFEPLLRKFNGQLFRMWNNDVIIGVKAAHISDIDDYILKLRFLFSEDPLLTNADQTEPQFCDWYDMEADHPAFKRLAHSFISQATAQRQNAALAARAPVDAVKPLPAAEAEMASPLTPVLLDRLEAALRGADLSPLIDRQLICAVVGGSKPQPVLSQHFVSIRAIQNRFLPGVNCLGDRWLFQRLCQALDVRMLAALPGMAKDAAEPLTININISTILSPEFLKFDAAMRHVTHRAVVLELQSIDLFANMGGYIFARDFAHDRGYRVALGGLDHLSFPLLDRAKLKLDFEKIMWNPEIIRSFNSDRRESFAKAIKQAGPARIILSRCASQDAVDFGLDAGIRLFQGWHIDHMLASA